MSHSSYVPLYQQIVDHYRKAIDTGVLKPGDQLPSGSQLGHTYNCNLNTGYKALRILQQQGYVVAGQGGSFVAPLSVLWQHLAELLNTMERRGENPTLIDGGGVTCIMGKSGTAAWHPEGGEWQMEAPE